LCRTEKKAKYKAAPLCPDTSHSWPRRTRVDRCPFCFQARISSRKHPKNVKEHAAVKKNVPSICNKNIEKSDHMMKNDGKHA
jgi:hypothetical protein